MAHAHGGRKKGFEWHQKIRPTYFQHYTVKQNLSFPLINTGAEHGLYLEHVSASCKDFENISKKRRKMQVKPKLQQ